ncbi:LysR family transcriptional regulator [Vibrio chagasii]|uniref:LysR family transcriptional regulator n=1 Tax=Vibrio chagasii TaxID=170679 RepID=UPI0022834F89|nr:LysR family transcriptional regulator [Vibrio chagasii]MCY9824545.1 LysR family transcriptional regulator [Vibrio chagasii]
MDVNLNDIRLFTQTVIHGGISAAAKANNMQRSKVSRRIQALEEQLGFELLIRTTRTIELTQSGKYLYERVSKQLYQIEQNIQNLKESKEEYTGKVRLAIPSALMTSETFNIIIAEYSARFPNIQMEIENHQDSVNLKREAFDLQVLPSGVEVMDDSYVQFTLLPYASRLVASKEYLDANTVCSKLSDLKNHRILSNRYSAQLLDESTPIHLRSDDLNLLHTLALQHQGIAFLPYKYTDKSVKAGLLVDVLPETTFPLLNLSMVYPSAKELSPKVRALIELFKDKFK